MKYFKFAKYSHKHKFFSFNYFCGIRNIKFYRTLYENKGIKRCIWILGSISNYLHGINPYWYYSMKNIEISILSVFLKLIVCSYHDILIYGRKIFFIVDFISSCFYVKCWTHGVIIIKHILSAFNDIFAFTTSFKILWYCWLFTKRWKTMKMSQTKPRELLETMKKDHKICVYIKCKKLWIKK